MAITDRVNLALKQAMKDKAPERLSTLRLINVAIKDKSLEMRGRGDASDVSDADILAILAKMTKQRQESARVYEEGGRIDLAERERNEILIISEFLPRQLDESEIFSAIDNAISQVGAVSIRDMGRVMSMLKANYAGQIDFGRVGPLLKDRLCKN
ncbi:MAG: GatB/YqeY domain-containing protein [Aestuariivita sp.]|nr:GatB/YqeY domain-containing protein [Aestuariivita sp.]